MKATGTTAVRVDEHGRIPEGAAELAAKVGSLLRSAAEPVVSARVTLAVAAAELDLLDCDFHLFTERSASGEPERGDPWPHRGCG